MGFDKKNSHPKVLWFQKNIFDVCEYPCDLFDACMHARTHAHTQTNKQTKIQVEVLILLATEA